MPIWRTAVCHESTSLSRRTQLSHEEAPRTLRIGARRSFVVAFAAFVVLIATDRGSNKAAPPAGASADQAARPEGAARRRRAAATWSATRRARSRSRSSSAAQLSLRGRTHADWSTASTITLPDKNGKTITVKSPRSGADGAAGPTRSARRTSSAASSSGRATASTVTADKADLRRRTTDVARIPGPLTFTRGRMKGTGVGAHLRPEPRRAVAARPGARSTSRRTKRAQGAVHVTSKRAGMARAGALHEVHGDAHLDGEGRVIDADEATVYPHRGRRAHSADGAARQLAHHRQPGAQRPQDMRARDIDLAYADDGRTLQSAQLVENAVVQLPGDAGKAGRRDRRQDDRHRAWRRTAATVTNLTANENVQVDLPPDGDTPARRIRSATLVATGAPVAAGIQERATFTGNVDYRETRAGDAGNARRDRAAPRVAERLDVTTKPGSAISSRPTSTATCTSPTGRTRAPTRPAAIYDVARGPPRSSSHPVRATRATDRTSSRRPACSVEATHDPDGAHVAEDEGRHEGPQRRCQPQPGAASRRRWRRRCPCDAEAG